MMHNELCIQGSPIHFHVVSKLWKFDKISWTYSLDRWSSCFSFNILPSVQVGEDLDPDLGQYALHPGSDKIFTLIIYNCIFAPASEKPRLSIIIYISFFM